MLLNYRRNRNTAYETQFSSINQHKKSVNFEMIGQALIPKEPAGIERNMHVTKFTTLRLGDLGV